MTKLTKMTKSANEPSADKTNANDKKVQVNDNNVK